MSKRNTSQTEITFKGNGGYVDIIVNGNDVGFISRKGIRYSGQAMIRVSEHGRSWVGGDCDGETMKEAQDNISRSIRNNIYRG